MRSVFSIFVLCLTFALFATNNREAKAMELPPTPIIPDQYVTICSGDAFTVSPINNPPSTIVPPGTTYTWSAPVIIPLGSVAGGSAQSTPQNNISQVLYNSTNQNATVTYIVTPSDGNFAGTPFNVIVTVKPKPQIQDNSNSICSEDNFTENPATNLANIVPLGTTYTWTAPTLSLPGSITGGSAESLPQSVINQTLTNTTNSTSEIASYIVTPSANGCTGSPFILHMGVNPKKKTNEDITICQGQTHSVGINTYSVSGTYHDTLVTYLGCDSIINTNLTVRPRPIANFNTNTPCLFDSTFFTNLSISDSSNSSNITSINWNFGDGSNFSSSYNPSHIYSFPNSYIVNLNITNSFGCKDSISKIVIVRPKPVANFTNDSSCLYNTTNFYNLSISNSPSITNINWNFGDGFVSALSNPSHFYSSSGSYNVSLKIINSYGCKDSITKQVVIDTLPLA